jgi:hypothetical protein
LTDGLGYVVAMETDSPLPDCTRCKELEKQVAELAAQVKRFMANRGDTRKLIVGEMKSNQKMSRPQRWFRTFEICSAKKNGEFGVATPRKCSTRRAMADQ